MNAQGLGRFLEDFAEGDIYRHAAGHLVHFADEQLAPDPYQHRLRGQDGVR